jgi:hypothetical protein
MKMERLIKKSIAYVLLFAFAMQLLPLPYGSAFSAVEPDGIYAEITGNDTKGDVVINAALGENVTGSAITLFYKQSPALVYEQIEMKQQDTSNVYTATLSGSNIWSDSLNWYVQAASGEIVKSTEPQSSNVVCKVDSEDASPLLVTEINKANTKGTTYSYFELYNNSDSDIDLKDYTIYYTYPGGSWLEWTFDGQNNPQGTNHHPTESIILGKGKSVIVWPGGTTITLEQFNSYWGTSLVQGQDIIRIAHGGFHSTDKRIVRIGKSVDSIITTAVVDAADNLSKAKVVNQYTYRVDGSTGYKFSNTSLPSIGTVDSYQIPDSPVHYEMSVKPTIKEIISKDNYGENEAVTISANIENTISTTKVYLYYKTIGEYKKIEMHPEDGLFVAEIDKGTLVTDSFSWYVEATDGSPAGTTQSEEKSSTAANTIDLSKEPPLIFTEALPVYQTGYQYTYAEIFNNSSSEINLSYYNFYYHYTGTTTAPKTWKIDEPNVMIKPGETMVLWLNSDGSTVDEFNQAFGTNLILNKDIVKINYSGFHNSQWRTFTIGRTIDAPIASIDFNENGVADVTSGSGRSVQYTYPRNPESGISLKVSNTMAPSPGTVETWQVPNVRVGFAGYPEYTDTGASPVVTKVSIPDSINEGEELFATFDCSDEIGLLGMSIYYRFDGQGEYKKVYEAKQRVSGKFFARIPANEILKHDLIEFYVEGYNIYRTTKTDTYTVDILPFGIKDGVRLNVNDGSLLRGIRTITASDGSVGNINTQMFINNALVETKPAIENGAYFSVVTAGQDNYFKNVLTAPFGDNEREVISYFGAWTNMDARAVLVDSKYFTTDENGDYKIKLTMWAGDTATPFEDIYQPSANHEDYTATNVKLVLANGEEILPDRAFQDYTYSGDKFKLDVTSPEYDRIYKIGDTKNGTMAPSVDFYFTIPKDKVTAVGYELDTTSFADGTYEIKAVSGAYQDTANVILDNTAPNIDLEIKENAVVAGKVYINPVVTDANGIDQTMVAATLDGTEIELPYEISTQDMIAGSHTLKVVAADLCGNITAKEVAFTTNEASKYNIATESSMITTNSAKLSATIEPSSDISKAEFLAGKNLSVEDGSIKVKKGDVKDGDLPYEIITLAVGNAGDNDLIIANYNGTANYSDAERVVTMYVFNNASNKWEMLERADEQGNISVSFNAKNHVVEGKATLLVQCRTEGQPSVPVEVIENENTEQSDWDGTGIPQNYDFSMAWITDTQYYTETYHDHFPAQNKWIVDNRDKLNIRYTMHTGDIIDEWDMDYQWKQADSAMKIFDDANMPYGVLGGNHDVEAGLEEYDNYWKYFGEDRFKDKDYYGGSYKNNLGHYDLLTENGQDLIILYMSWDIYTDEINWMNDVLEQYKDRKAIICLHRYSNVKITDNSILDYAGQVLQEQVVAKNENVIAVLNGHYHGASIQIDNFTNSDGTERLVYQICTDYQSDSEGGSQYIKFLYFDLKNDKIYMNSYSPYRDDFNYFDAPKLETYDKDTIATELDIYELDVDFDTNDKTLQTNSFSASVYNQDIIGESALNEGKAEFVWTGLEQDTNYGWYVRIKNELGEEYTTPINMFKTIKSSNNGGGKSDNNDGNSNDNNANPGNGADGANPDAGNNIKEKFSDVSGWYEDYVYYLTERNIIKGMGDGTFNPNGNITRAQFITILANIQGIDLDSFNKASFSDVKSSDWYSGAVQWAYENGIVTGWDGRFNPNQNIARQDIAVMIMNYVNKVANYSLPDINGAKDFADSDDIAAYAADAVTKMQQANIINGKDNERFEPESNATRAEACKMVALLLQKMGK